MTINNSCQIEQTNDPSNLVSSIDHLIKILRRRQKWHNYIGSSSSIYKELPNTNMVAPWRVKLVCLLESPQAQITAIFLLVIDLALSILELSSSITSNSCKSNRQVTKLETIWYHWVGISILALMFLKTMLLVVGLGGSFFKKPGYVVDGLVVLVALVLEVVSERLGGGLLVVVSLWRVVRALEGVYELSDDAIEAKIEELFSQLDVFRKENKRLLERFGQEDRMTAELQQEVIDA